MRKFAVFAVIFVALVMLSACGGGSSHSSTAATPATSVLTDADTASLENVGVDVSAIDSMTPAQLVSAAETYTNSVISSSNSGTAVTADQVTAVNAYYKMAAQTSDTGKVLYSVTSLGTAVNSITDLLKTKQAKTSTNTNYLSATYMDQYPTLITDIDNSITMLGTIPSSFAANVTFDGKTYAMDYGDVLSLRAALYAVKTTILTTEAYNMSSETTYANFEDYLTNDTTLFTPKTDVVSYMTQAKASFLSMLADVKAAKASILAETDDQSNNLVVIDTNNSEVSKGITQFDEDYDNAVASINGGSAFTPTGFAYNVSFNLANAFSGLNIRTYIDQVNAGTVSDMTFGGSLVGTDANLLSFLSSFGY